MNVDLDTESFFSTLPASPMSMLRWDIGNWKSCGKDVGAALQSEEARSCTQ